VHIPEGFLSGEATAIGAGVAVAGMAFAISRADVKGDDGRLPLAGLAGAFFLVGDTPFIPIGVGTQGHLLGGTLAVALLGPWLGMLTIAVVTIVQALVQGDGGITVLGLNIVNAALVPAFIGYPILRLIQTVVRRIRGRSTAGGLALACAVAAYVNVLLAACLFVLEFHLGHQGAVDIEPVIGGTIGVYAFVGVIEAIVTAGIVRALLARRPDLVLIAPPELRPKRRRPRARPATAGPRVPPPAGSEPQGPRTAGVDSEAATVPPPAGCEPQGPRTGGSAGPGAMIDDPRTTSGGPA
jgi:cobalt/nickel transport system permease protein